MPPRLRSALLWHCGDGRERRGLARQRFQRRERCLELFDQSRSGVELGVGEQRARIGAMQRRRFAASEFRKLVAECRQRMRQPRAAGLRPRPAQHRALQHRHRAAIEPAHRVLEQRQQRHRRQAFERRLGDEPREHAGRRVGQRVAAGIVHRHVPARQRRQHAAGQRAGRASPAPRSCPASPSPRAAQPQSPAPPLRRCRLRSRRCP